jgi:hypothetical protein
VLFLVALEPVDQLEAAVHRGEDLPVDRRDLGPQLVEHVVAHG